MSFISVNEVLGHGDMSDAVRLIDEDLAGTTTAEAIGDGGGVYLTRDVRRITSYIILSHFPTDGFFNNVADDWVGVLSTNGI